MLSIFFAFMVHSLQQTDFATPKTMKPGLRRGHEINEKNQMEIFSILILVLDLNDFLQKPRSFLHSLRQYSFTKQYPFCFEVRRAVKLMQLLQWTLELNTVSSTISYSVKPDLAFSLLKRYYAAHLLHCPISRTEDALSESMTVQITPKGTATVYNFWKSMGLTREKMPLVVKSSFNSIHMFSFDRSHPGNKLLYSEYLLYILITQMMGPTPNVWSSRQSPCMVKCIADDEHVSISSLSFSSEVMAHHFGDLVQPSRIFVSPFHHKYFTNPESDAHIQYYESESGLRVFQNKVFKTEEREVIINFCFTGKAISQWLLDCTVLSSRAETLDIGNLLLKYGLLTPITLAASAGKFSAHKEAYYILSPRGERACRWNSEILGLESLGSIDLRQDIQLYEESSRKVNLKSVLLDPGMRYLFKQHMEKERCSENLIAYLNLAEFAKLKSQLSQLLKIHSGLLDEVKKGRLASIIENQACICYSLAFHLYLTYLSLESMYDLNIGFGLRQEIISVMEQARESDFLDSPLMSTPQVDYMKTPVCETVLDFSEEIVPIKPAFERPASCTVELPTLMLNSGKMLLAEIMSALSRIYDVFGKIASSIYRLMEVDSYPKFVKSEEYLYAVDIDTHRS